jgi:hypothetical protein
MPGGKPFVPIFALKLPFESAFVFIEAVTGRSTVEAPLAASPNIFMS